MCCGFLLCDIVIFSTSTENNNICVFVCTRMFTFSVSWEYRDGRGCESCLHGAYPLSHTARRAGECKAYRLSQTWSIPAASSPGKLIVVWSAHKRQQKENKWTNNHVSLMERWSELALGTCSQVFLCSHAVLPLEFSPKKKKAGVAAIRDDCHRHFRKSECAKKSFFGCRVLEQKRGVFVFCEWAHTLQGQGQTFHKEPFKSTLTSQRRNLRLGLVLKRVQTLVMWNAMLKHI